MTDTSTPFKPLEGMLLADLKRMAGALGLKGTTAMRKGDLVAAIKAQQNGGQHAPSSEQAATQQTAAPRRTRSTAEPATAADVAETVSPRADALRSWIEIGAPDPARLHKASKASPRVAVYSHKDSERWAQRLAGERIHRIEALEVYVFDPALIGALASRLDRRMAFALSISERELFVSIGAETLSGRVTRRPIS